MSNDVYNTTLQALSRMVPESDARMLLNSALLGQAFTPADVTPPQMQRTLAGPLLQSLMTVVPPERAETELRALAGQIEREYAGAASLLGVGVSSGQEGPGQGGAADDFGADDFEFDDPEYSTTLQVRRYDLRGTAGQDELIRDLGKMQGVHGVLVTRANGEMLRVKAMRDAAHLGSVIAATALLFRQRGLRMMSADLGGQIICMRPLGEYSVAVLAGPNVNIGRLLAELQQVGDAS